MVIRFRAPLQFRIGMVHYAPHKVSRRKPHTTLPYQAFLNAQQRSFFLPFSAPRTLCSLSLLKDWREFLGGATSVQGDDIRRPETTRLAPLFIALALVVPAPGLSVRRRSSRRTSLFMLAFFRAFSSWRGAFSSRHHSAGVFRRILSAASSPNDIPNTP